jgi:hypothetical protein
MNVSMLVVVTILLLVFLCSLPSFFRWQKRQKELKEKVLSNLSSRSERLLFSLEMVSDRYLTKDTRIFLIEYLLFCIAPLKKVGYQSDIVEKQEDLIRWLTDLKLGNHTLNKDRVGSQAELEQIHNALQSMVREARNISDSFGVSRALIRHHVVLIRYAHDLAYRDLLVRQARYDLENDKKNRALEKYRTALSVMERNGSVNSSKREKVRLQNMIQDVENLLFAKKNKAELESK